jgi:competence protein ComEA
VLDDLVPPTLRGRVAVGPAQLTVVALVVAAGLALTCWWAVRGDAEPVRAPAIEPVADSASALVDVSPVAASGSASPSVTVDVAGKVRRPGIVVLDAGARVVDAIRAAGGARAGVGLGDVNLARLLVDGEQVVVGAQPAPAPVGGTTAGGPSPAAPGAPGTPLVDLNTATQAELETLPEVGPVTAQAILTWRAEHGAFTSVDELLEVDGIGDATLAQLAPYVTV